MAAKSKPRLAQRSTSVTPASPLTKGAEGDQGGSPKGVAARASPLAKGGQRGVVARPSALLDTRIIYCGDCLDQLCKLPDACPRSESGACVDLIYIDPPFNSNRNYEVFWGETKEKRAFEDHHASTQAYIDYMRPRCGKLARTYKGISL